MSNSSVQAQILLCSVASSRKAGQETWFGYPFQQKSFEKAKPAIMAPIHQEYWHAGTKCGMEDVAKISIPPQKS